MSELILYKKDKIGGEEDNIIITLIHIFAKVKSSWIITWELNDFTSGTIERALG